MIQMWFDPSLYINSFFLMEISLFVPSFGILLLKWSFGNQQLLYSIYEDLAVISIYLFYFSGGESRVQL